MDAAADVVFDYSGALSAARRLWALADQISTTMGTREMARDAAAEGFIGLFATQLSARIGQERTDIDSAITQLCTGATEWAAAWKEAIDEQNRVRYSRAYEYSEDHQGLLGRLDGVERPPDVVSVSVPSPPGFRPTGGLQNFGKMA